MACQMSCPICEGNYDVVDGTVTGGTAGDSLMALSSGFFVNYETLVVCASAEEEEWAQMEIGSEREWRNWTCGFVPF